MKPKTTAMFQDASDLPLFSGTPQRVPDSAFHPQETHTQPALPGMELKMHDTPIFATPLDRYEHERSLWEDYGDQP